MPFVGAGISAPNCVLWSEFIENLETQAGIQKAVQSLGASPVGLVQRAAQVVRKIRNECPGEMGNKVRNALCSKVVSTVCPPGSVALAGIWWPLVITTNYDDWFFTEWNKCHAMRDPSSPTDRTWERMEICGRSDSDCHRIVNSLRAPDNPLLWAVQGFAGNLSGNWEMFNWFNEERRREFESQLIVGHAEYRHKAFRALAFRRALAEVFRSRSLLFIGSGLTEEYFGSLFDEVLELQGALPHMHYALIKQGSMSVQFLRERFQIHAIEVPDYPDIANWLNDFKKRSEERGSRNAMWGYCVNPTPQISAEPPSLQIIWSKVPMPAQSECILISSGIDPEGNARPSGVGVSDLCAYFPDIRSAPRDQVGTSSPRVWKFDPNDSRLCGISSRNEFRFEYDPVRDRRMDFAASGVRTAEHQ